MSWRDLLVLCMYAQPETATHKALNDSWPASLDSELLRSIEFTNRVLIWQRTEDARRRRNQPQPFRWPWEPEPVADGAMKGDSLSWEEAEAVFGLVARMRREQGLDPEPEG